MLSLVNGDVSTRNQQNTQQGLEPKTLPVAQDIIGSIPDENSLDFLMERLKTKVDRPASRASEARSPEAAQDGQEAPKKADTVDLSIVRRPSSIQRETKTKVVPDAVAYMFPQLKNPSEINDFLNPDKNLGDVQAVSRINAIDARVFLLNKKAVAKEVLGMLQQGNSFRTPKMAYQALLFFLQMDTFKKAAPYLLNNHEDKLFTDEERALILGFARQFSKMDLASIQAVFAAQPFLGMDDQDLEGVLSTIAARESRGYNYRPSYSNLSYVDKVVLGLLFLQLENLSNSSEKMSETQRRFFNELQLYYVDQLEGIFCISIWRMEEGMKGFLKDTFFSVFTQKLNFEALSKLDFPFKARKLLEMKYCKDRGI